VAARWATFDCYGTLIDWEGGLRAALARVFGEDRADAQVARYHEVEPGLQAGGERSYREVMADAMRALGAEGADAGVLADSLPSWRAFPEVPGALRAARERGWRLALLSNTDRDFADASMRTIGVPFERAVVASEIRSYKPAHGHWSTFFGESGADRERTVHVAQSHFHDIVPATELGLRSIWINRLGEHGEPSPTRALPDLADLPETLDELVPA
jgi:2-haloacid dehalogenase